MMDWNDGGGAGSWLIIFTIMIIFWGGVAWAVVAVVRRNGSPSGPTSQGQANALRILDDRFARGEIDEQEYRSLRAALASHS